MQIRIRPRNDDDPADAASNFWVPTCFKCGMMLKVKNKYFLATGTTPAVIRAPHLHSCVWYVYINESCFNRIERSQAVALIEMPWKFQGSLPEGSTDESCIPNPEKSIAAMPDPLRQSDCTQCLVLDTSKSLGSN